MSVTLTLYKNASNPNKLDKVLTLVGAISNVAWLDELDEENPSIRLLDANAKSYLEQADYAQVDGKYYFVEPNWVADKGEKIIARLNFDPLTTYATAIKGLSAYMDRTPTGNPYVPDDQDETLIYKDQQMGYFPKGFADSGKDTIILVTSRREHVNASSST